MKPDGVTTVIFVCPPARGVNCAVPMLLPARMVTGEEIIPADGVLLIRETCKEAAPPLRA